METPCVVRGEKFIIPVSTDISYTWSEKYSVKYNGDDDACLANCKLNYDSMRAKLKNAAEFAVQNAI